MFEALGLTEEETRIYAELVRQGPCRIDRLPALTRLPPEQIEAALKGLAEQGLLTHTEGARPRVIASPLDIAGEVLLLRRMQELHTARDPGPPAPQLAVQHPSSGGRGLRSWLRNGVSNGLRAVRPGGGCPGRSPPLGQPPARPDTSSTRKRCFLFPAPGPVGKPQG
ncbi:helix-turn-helix domain-containing protein, partial [Streptomyces sp. NPDC057580]|uniref:helix-turn-helix domain-containing protein n=1 Tax=Streptomyces sp. NPDC057580 TaxID=3346173 RepID=UPI0036AA213E